MSIIRYNQIYITVKILKKIKHDKKKTKEKKSTKLKNNN